MQQPIEKQTADKVQSNKITSASNITSPEPCTIVKF